MKRSWFYRLLRAIAVVQLIFLSTCLVDLVLHPNASGIGIGRLVPVRLIIGFIVVPLILVVGGLILRRTQGNLIGWLLLMMAALLGSLTLRADAFGGHAATLQLIGSFTWPTIWTIPIFFPDGRAYPRRIEAIIHALVVVLLSSQIVAVGTNQLLASATMDTGGIANPFYAALLAPLRESANAAFNICLFPLLILMPTSVILRFRAARGRERQQIKYMVWTAVLIVVLIVFNMTTGIIGQDDPATYTGMKQVLYAILITAYAVLPVFGIGSAILRHRLYDIDLIIRRTLIYAVLTAILALVYFGGVVLVQPLFRVLTGQSSDLAIVISTLGSAALFTPLRRRIQKVIDRRLYRRKYDAEQMVTAFSLTLRDEVDLDKMTAALVGVVQETMQPTQIALWIKD